MTEPRFSDGSGAAGRIIIWIPDRAAVWQPAGIAGPGIRTAGGSIPRVQPDPKHANGREESGIHGGTEMMTCLADTTVSIIKDMV